LSMLRQVFYGPNPVQPNGLWRVQASSERLLDAGPREIFVILTLLFPIVAIGLFPTLATTLYRATTDALIHDLFGQLTL
jgi:NAD(P)H-quinone oxidoreductase subunit 4